MLTSFIDAENAMPLHVRCSACGSAVPEDACHGDPPHLCPPCEAARQESLPPTTFADPDELTSSNRTAMYVLALLVGGGGLMFAGVVVVLGFLAMRIGDEEAADANDEPTPVVAATTPKPAVKVEPEKPREVIPPKIVPPGPKETKPPIPTPPPPIPMVQPNFPPNIPPPFRPNPRPVEPEKPKLRFLSTSPVEVKPAPLTADTVEVKLPGIVTDTCVGGGGRFWCLQIRSTRQLAIFDANEAKVVKYLPIPADARVAAGMNKLVVIDPNTNTVARYDLRTFAKEKTAKLAFSPSSAVMGSASAGPLIVRVEGQFRAVTTTFLDLSTLEEVRVANQERLGFGLRGEHLRVSPDGRVLGAWSSRSSPGGLNSILLSPSGLEGYSQHTSAGFIQPTANGQLMTALGVYTLQTKALNAGRDVVCLRVPSQTGAWYLRIPGGGGAQINTGKTGVSGPTEVLRVGEDRPIATLNHVKLPAENEAWVAHDFTGDKRVLFVPDARLIAVIPPTHDRIVLHRFDVEAALEKSGVDYLFVNSRPPLATPGKIFRYPVSVKSKAGSVKLRLDAVPEGMKLDGQTLVWNVPADWSGPESIVLAYQDASEREELYSFTLAPPDPELEAKK